MKKAIHGTNFMAAKASISNSSCAEFEIYVALIKLDHSQKVSVFSYRISLFVFVFQPFSCLLLFEVKTMAMVLRLLFSNFHSFQEDFRIMKIIWRLSFRFAYNTQYTENMLHTLDQLEQIKRRVYFIVLTAYADSLILNNKCCLHSLLQMKLET